MRRMLLGLLVLAGCAESASVLPPPLPAPPPSLATIAAARGGTRVQGFVGRPLPDEVVALLVSGGIGDAEPWMATSRRGSVEFEESFGSGSGVLRWSRGTAPLGPGMRIDTITVALTAHPGAQARFIDTVEALPVPAALTMLVNPRSRAVHIVYGDDAPDGSATVSLAPAATDGGAWCVSPSAGVTLTAPLPTATCTADPNGGVVRWQRTVAGRGPGIHVDTLRLWRNGALNSPAMVLDTLVVLPGPGPFAFELSDSARADTVDVGAAAVDDAITVQLAGKGSATTNWTATAQGPGDWLSVVTSVGVGAGDLRWRRDPAGLVPGVYAATILVRVAGDPVPSITVHDTLVVKGPHPGNAFASTLDAWSGSEFRVSSDALEFRGEGASLLIGAIRFPLVRLDPLTLGTTLPETMPGGSVTPILLLDGYRIPLSSLTIYGFTRFHAFDHTALNDTYAWPRDGAASALAQGTDGLVLFDLDAGTSRVLDVPSTTNIRGPGATPDPDVFIIRNGPRMQSWRLRPVPTLVEVFDDFYNAQTRQAMQMSANTMFITPGQHYFQRYRRPHGSAPFTLVTNELEQAEEVEGVYLSPRGDRATVRVDGVDLGVPVFDAATAAIAFRAPLRGSNGVDWSPDGSRLVMGGRGIVSPYPPHLVVLDAGTGALLGEKAFTQPIAAVASDDLRPYLYVLLEDNVHGLALQVLDKATLEVLATMRPGATTTAETGCCYRAVIAPSRITSTVHVFWWRYSWEFTVPEP